MAFSGDTEERKRKQREQMRAWRAANAERDRESLRAWRAANPEKVALQRQRQRAKDAPMRDEYNARRRAEYDPEQRSAHRLKNLERARKLSAENQSRRRAAMRGAKIEPVDRADIIARDKSTCHLCGKKVAKRDLVLDHIVPLVVGGEHSARNLAVAHRSCNASKCHRAANDQLRLVG